MLAHNIQRNGTMTQETNKTEQLQFLLMWHADWKLELHKEEIDLEMLDFYAAMAEEAAQLAGCHEVLSETLLKCAARYNEKLQEKIWAA